VVAVSRRSSADKFEQRREQLAESALKTLGELGYARTSLREVANNSEFSHGVLHYYFADKLELIVYSVRYYKALCVHRYDEVIESSRTAPGLLDAFADKLVETIVEEAPLHRLWYDLRCQAMFQEGLREAVLGIDKSLEEMVWRVVSRYSELTGRPPAMAPAAAYGVLDGLFQQALLGHVTGDTGALPRLVGQVHELLPLTLGPPVQ
jgi:AcrR family transcriptional regulator